MAVTVEHMMWLSITTASAITHLLLKYATGKHSAVRAISELQRRTETELVGNRAIALPVPAMAPILCGALTVPLALIGVPLVVDLVVLPAVGALVVDDYKGIA